MESPNDPVTFTEVMFSDASSLEAIGRLRYKVWLDEGSLDVGLFPEGKWLDSVDAEARHFVAVSSIGSVVGSARLVTHATAETADRDVELWLKTGHDLKFPVCDLGRLVVDRNFRSRGIAKNLNEMRIEAARVSGAHTVIATASAANASLLLKIGFVDIGQTVVFSDRPNTVFYALQLDLAEVSTPPLIPGRLQSLLNHDDLAQEALSFLPEIDGLFALSCTCRGLDRAVLRGGGWRLRLRRALDWPPIFHPGASSDGTERAVSNATTVDDGSLTDFAIRRRFVHTLSEISAWGEPEVSRVRVFKGHPSGVNCIALHSSVSEGVFSSHHPLMASGGMDSEILLWPSDRDDSSSEASRLQYGAEWLGEPSEVAPSAVLTGHTGPVTGLRWASDSLVLSVSYDGSLRSWDASHAAFASGRGAMVSSWVVHDDRVLAFDYEGVAVSGGRDGSLRVIDLRSRDPVSRIQTGDPCVYSVSKQGDEVVCGTHEGHVQTWDLRQQRSHLSSTRVSGRPVTALVFKGRFIAAGSKDGKIIMLNGRSQLLLGDVKNSYPAHYWAEGIRSLAIASHGRSLISSSNDKTVRIWDISDYGFLSDLDATVTSSETLGPPFSPNLLTKRCTVIENHTAQVTCLEVSGSTFFSSSIDGTIIEHLVSKKCGV